MSPIRKTSASWRPRSAVKSISSSTKPSTTALLGIGRESCRGRGEISVGGGSLKKKKKDIKYQGTSAETQNHSNYQINIILHPANTIVSLLSLDKIHVVEASIIKLVHAVITQEVT